MELLNTKILWQGDLYVVEKKGIFCYPSSPFRRPFKTTFEDLAPLLQQKIINETSSKFVPDVRNTAQTSDNR